VFGPHDPHFGESAQIVANVLKLRMPLVPHGGLSIVDVRDLARAHAAMVAPGLGPRRYVFGGTNVSFAAIVHTLAEETGRRIPVVSLPAWSLSPFARAGGALQRVLPFRLPLNVEGFDTLAWNPRTDDSRAREELGFAPRPTGETLRDTAAWLYRDGRISARQAGKLAGA
jgi:dihydroflavonol-4-reductase